MNNGFFKNKYRISSLRLQEWDYSSNGYYFITICTDDKICYFGKVKERKIYLSNIGNIINQEWKKTAIIRKGIQLDEYVIMPNHIHGIIIIKSKTIVETHCNASLHTLNNISYIIRGFKSASSKRIRELHPSFQWQSRFYDHIIRTEEDLLRIREYIRFNPLKWEEV